ncbi:MAG: hydroxyisourate hydrolase [Arenimonas sp.]|jgi:5-hydroxyisourate hydrolase
MAKLTTHVLDTAHGQPAAGVVIGVYRVDREGRSLLGRFLTNADGRCDTALLADETLRAGVYELDFAIGDYFAGRGVAQSEPRFLDVVTLRIGIADANTNYHVPLLASPYAYSTYRGS